jgi:hypothetical protein
LERKVGGRGRRIRAEEKKKRGGGHDFLISR